jgi:acyl-CoA reductase-like NAD-dependent aldehyde dehydrogenase
VVELFHEAGIPKGVLNYLSISKEAAPGLTAELIANPLVRKINVVLSPAQPQ